MKKLVVIKSFYVFDIPKTKGFDPEWNLKGKNQRGNHNYCYRFRIVGSIGLIRYILFF